MVWPPYLDVKWLSNISGIYKITQNAIKKTAPKHPVPHISQNEGHDRIINTAVLLGKPSSRATWLFCSNQKLHLLRKLSLKACFYKPHRSRTPYPKWIKSDQALCLMLCHLTDPNVQAQKPLFLRRRRPFPSTLWTTAQIRFAKFIFAK